MTSPLKTTRENKQKLLRGIAFDAIDIISLKIGKLDRIDFRILKEVSRKLKEAKNRLIVVSSDTNKIVSSPRMEDMPQGKESNYQEN